MMVEKVFKEEGKQKSSNRSYEHALLLVAVTPASSRSEIDRPARHSATPMNCQI
jgi:hypothetical protein